MSWNRQIKILYTISINTFFFILWATVLNGFLSGRVDYKLFLLSLYTAFSMTYILEKTKKIKFAIASSLLTSIAILFLIYGNVNVIINIIYICFILFITNINEEQDVNYEIYKDKAKQAIILLVAIGFIFSFTKVSNKESILKFYIIFLISASILMREGRNYYYRIKNKKSFITNIFIVISIIFISLDSVFNIILSCFRYLGSFLYKIVDPLANEIIKLLAIIISKPLEIMIDFFKKGFSNNPGLLDKMYGAQDNLQNNNINIINRTRDLPSWITATLKLIIVFIFIYIVYRLFFKFKSYKSLEFKGDLEERTKLTKEKSYNESFIKKAVKSIFKLSDFKEQAVNVYKRFEYKTNEKGIFKKHMTARQLENITKAYIKNSEGINDLTDIYNEAKFSKHKVTKEQVETMKESYNKIKKQFY